MNVEVEYVTGVQSELFRLLRRRTSSAEDALRYTGLFLDDIEEQLAEHEAELPGAVRRLLLDGSRWWWKYIDGVWMAYTLTDRRRAWVFGPTTRTVLVHGFDAVPPPP